MYSRLAHLSFVMEISLLTSHFNMRRRTQLSMLKSTYMHAKGAVVVPYCSLFLLSVFILWFTYNVSDIFSYLNDQLSEKELFIWSTAHAFRKLLSMYVFSYFALVLIAGYGI